MKSEMLDFIRFFFNTNDAYKHIIIYAEHKGYTPIYERLINDLTKNYNLKLSVITSQKNYSRLNKNNNIELFYINNLLGLFMRIVDCKIMVMTTPDLDNYHIKKSINNVHYMYMFHALVSTHMMYRADAFNNYDTIICNGKYQIKEIREYEAKKKLRKKNLVSSSYNRIERITFEYENYFNNNKSNEGTKTLLIAPSWGEDNLIESIGENLIKLLLENNYEVILRPHPEMLKRKPNSIKYLNEKFSTYSKYKLDTKHESNDSMIIADLLICDCSGIALEYSFGTKRPVLFFDVPVKIKNKSYKELDIEPFELSTRSIIGEIVDPYDLNHSLKIISKLLEETNQYSQIIDDLIKQNLFLDNQSTSNEAKFIANYINSPQDKT